MYLYYKALIHLLGYAPIGLFSPFGKNSTINLFSQRDYNPNNINNPLAIFYRVTKAVTIFCSKISYHRTPAANTKHKKP